MCQNCKVYFYDQLDECDYEPEAPTSSPKAVPKVPTKRQPLATGPWATPKDRRRIDSKHPLLSILGASSLDPFGTRPIDRYPNFPTNSDQLLYHCGFHSSHHPIFLTRLQTSLHAHVCAFPPDMPIPTRIPSFGHFGHWLNKIKFYIL